MAAGDGPAAPPPAPRGDVSGRTASRVVVWAVLTSCLCILVASAQPLALALRGALPVCLVCSCTRAQPGRRPLSVTAFVPGGFVLTVASALVWGLAGGAAGIGAWSTRTASLLGLGLLVGTTGAISWRRGGRVVVVGRDAPALTGFIMVTAFFTLVVITQPLAWWSRINGSGTDFLRHLSVIRAVRADGSIQPGSPSYPKALHALVAWLANAMGLPAGADPMWRAAALVGFLMLALMLLAVMAVATRATIAISGSRTAGVLAGVVAGLVFVQTAWFSSFLAFGSVMNMLVAVCLLSAPAVRPPSRDLRVDDWHHPLRGVSGRHCQALAVAHPRRGPGCDAVDSAVPSVGGWRRPGDWAVWLLSAAVAFHGLLSLRGMPSAHASRSRCPICSVPIGGGGWRWRLRCTSIVRAAVRTGLVGP